MAKDRKLKLALDRHKGIDYKLEKQKKLQKHAEKRKRERQIDVSTAEEEDEEAHALAEDVTEKQNEEIAANRAQLKEKTNGQADGWESDESENVDDDEDEGGIEVGAMEDESDSDSEEEEEELAFNGLRENGLTEDEEDEDIPLSDIESLASEDRADVIPHQRLTINNTAALQRSLKSFALASDLPFSAVQSVTSSEPVTIADIEDDLNRELAFYRQSLNAVAEARNLLKKEGVAFTRPNDYFAEMVKSEEQMGKVRQKLVDEAARKKASADARRQRDLKKFGKAVQVAKRQEREKQTTEIKDRINTLKRKRQGAELTNVNEDDVFDVALENATKTAKSGGAARGFRGAAGGANGKRQKKDEKFGYGGKKRFAKSNDAKSTADLGGYSVNKMKRSQPSKQRPGKSKRARTS